MKKVSASVHKILDSRANAYTFHFRFEFGDGKQHGVNVMFNIGMLIDMKAGSAQAMYMQCEKAIRNGSEQQDRAWRYVAPMLFDLLGGL